MRRRQQHVLSESLGVSVSEFARRRSFAVGARKLTQGALKAQGSRGPEEIESIEHDVLKGAYATGNGEVLA